MAFRSHLLRPFDLRLVSNRLLFVMVGAIGLLSGYRWLGGEDVDVLWAAPHAGLVWALTRELDPDHDWSALVAGAGAGLWFVLGRPGAPVVTILGLMLAARVVVSTTGRRPLPTDLITMALVAVAISYTATGWVAGCGLALALYVDDRLAEGNNQVAVLASIGGALGASVVATISGALPKQAPNIDPVAVAVVGALALIAIIRQPATPLALVDSRMRFSIPVERLHTGRTLVGVLLFVASALAGEQASMLYPLAGAMALALITAELSRH